MKIISEVYLSAQRKFRVASPSWIAYGVAKKYASCLSIIELEIPEDFIHSRGVPNYGHRVTFLKREETPMKM